jgi:Methane oxygenase PmoA
MFRDFLNYAVLPFLVTIVGSLGSSVFGADVTVERSENGAVVKIDGQLFAEYLTHVGHQPAVWPINGPTGKPMTRQYPMGPLLPDEKNDHLHHVSLWFAHGNVNGLDFWTDRAKAAAHKDNQITHREFVTTTVGDGQAKIVTRNDWISEGQKICEDERTLLFGGDSQARWIDFLIKIKASEGDLTLGETKEGAFGLRVSGPLTVDAKEGASIVNSRGQHNADAWGMFADWVDDSGPVDGEIVGVTLFNHPSNFRSPTRWHARTYGLLAANPFGDSEFPKDPTAPQQAAVTIAKGQELALRYRVLLHRGDPEAAGVAAAYKQFAATPTPAE